MADGINDLGGIVGVFLFLFHSLYFIKYVCICIYNARKCILCLYLCIHVTLNKLAFHESRNEKVILIFAVHEYLHLE